MAKNTIHSIEEQVEDWCKRQFPSSADYYTKTQSINPEKHGKTNAQYYFLPRAYYELSGNIAKYSLITDGMFIECGL